MNRFCLFCSVFAIIWMTASSATAQHVAYKLTQPELVPAAATDADDSYARKDAEASPSDMPATHTPAAMLDMACTCQGLPCAEPNCGCDNGCGCCDCGSGWGDWLCGDCCLGDAWTLKSCLTPCCNGPNYGGWIAAGYYDGNERLSAVPGDGAAFLDVPDHLNLDQAWLFAEKVADGGDCSAGWGYRADVVYGVDAQKTQAFGNDDNVWDLSFDHGYYGWAIPQAYGEIAYGDLSVKVGHFFTVVGYEVVPATGNFFYSHSYTMFNSEPFTHTGVLGTYKANDCLTWYGGWTLGWDTGFDQAEGGSSWLGGFSTKLMDDFTVTYVSTAGNFGKRSAGENGYSQSVVAVADLTGKTQYVLQTDWVSTDGFSGDPTFHAEDYGINQYLFYTLSDCWKLGSRMEWWKSNTVTGESTSFYELTGGVNYHPHANFVVRPEVRYNWSPTELFSTANGAAFNNTVFAIDAIYTF
ncbi:MAG: outer membrane beta-barrel protein [Pirellulales bacterium]